MRINKKSDLPKWFNISNYEGLNSLPDAELFEQLSLRYHIFKFNYDFNVNQIEGMLGGVIINRSILNSSGNFPSVFENMGKQLPKTDSVTPISVHDYNRIAEQLDANREKYSDSVLGLFMDFESVNSYIHKDEGGFFYAKIDMSFPENMILDDLSNLIPKLRESLSIKKRAESSFWRWDMAKKRLLDYSLFPLIDLMIWEKISGNKITHSVKAVSIYTDGQYGETQITQTIKPNLDKIFNYFSIEKLRRELVDRKVL